MGLARELRFQIRLLRTTRTGAGGIARLRHESRNDAMEYDPIVEAFACQFLDARHMVRRELRLEPDHHATVFQLHDNGIFRSSHNRSGLSILRLA
jgi:hypothetical protein